MKLISIFLWIKISYASKPNIVIIMADDMGFNDVSFHGSNQIPTPNIDALAMAGVILNRHYVLPICTPSRAALMTGKHPINLGMQHYVIQNDEPWGLGLEEKIMPQYFKEAGYKTHIVGKWHLGFFKKAYTPTERGFDSHFGYFGGYIDYYDHTLRMLLRLARGLDMRKNLEVNRDSKGNYATDYFTNEAINIINNHNKVDPLLLYVAHLAPHSANEDAPLQAPLSTIRKFNYIGSPCRKIYAAMVSKVDDSVGQIFNALKNRNMLDNTIILFLSDNGAPTEGFLANCGSNHPLRGIKDTPWEAATRGVAAIWSPLISSKGRVSNQYFHITDWLPTLAAAAGIQFPKYSEIDGINQWAALSEPSLSLRKSLLVNIEPTEKYASYIHQGRWKYVEGSSYFGFFNGWSGAVKNDRNLTDDAYADMVANSIIGSELNVNKAIIIENRKKATITCNSRREARCNPFRGACLFDIINDPCERNNLANRQRSRLRAIQEIVKHYKSTAVTPRNKPGTIMANPALYGFVWTFWEDEEPIVGEEQLIEFVPTYMRRADNKTVCK